MGIVLSMPILPRDCQVFPTHRVTVLLGSRLASGISVNSSLLQLTLLPTACTPCALDRSSVQLQPLVEASRPGQASVIRGSAAHNSRSSIRTRRPGGRGMPNIVFRLDLTSAAPPPPVIPYLHHEASRWRWEAQKATEIIVLVLNEWFVQQWTISIRSAQIYPVPLCHDSGAQLHLTGGMWVHPSLRQRQKARVSLWKTFPLLLTTLRDFYVLRSVHINFIL